MYVQGDFPSRTQFTPYAIISQNPALFHQLIDAITFADAFLLVPQNIFNNICEGVLKIF